MQNLRLTILATLLCAFSLAVLGQEKTADKAMAAPGSVTDSFLKQSKRVQGQMEALLGAIPQEKFNWRPMEGVRSIAESFMHAGGEAELSVYELLLAQLGGNMVSLDDSSGNSNFVYGGTGALGVGLLRDTLQPRVAFRYSAWGSDAHGSYLEAGARIAGGGVAVDFMLDYGLSGPATWVAMVSIAWISAGSK